MIVHCSFCLAMPSSVASGEQYALLQDGAEITEAVELQRVFGIGHSIIHSEALIPSEAGWREKGTG